MLQTANPFLSTAAESFTETQKKRLLSWKQQVQRLFRSIPRKALLDMAGYRAQRSRFGQSNSLPTTGCVVSSVSARRSLHQFQMPSRSLPGARLGLLGSGGLLGPTPRSSSSTPTGLKQGRHVSLTGVLSQPSHGHQTHNRSNQKPEQRRDFRVWVGFIRTQWKLSAHKVRV
uniref:Uncharacterized protein n=1 Tax=Oryzias sinensis TaxID=183150 RepID=A0A8C7WS58_9TELE